MERKLIVGDVVMLNESLLGNEKGTKGCVYEEYDLGDGAAASVIFENGNYDGFSPDEQEEFLDFVGHCEDCESYVFDNVMRLSRDFDKGFFNAAFTISG